MVPSAVPSAVPAGRQGTSGRLRAAEAATRFGGGVGGGGGPAGAASALQVQAVAQTVGPGSVAAAVCYTNAGLLHRAAQGGGGASEAAVAAVAAAAVAAAAASGGVPGLRREASGGAQAAADQAGRRRPMKGVPRTEEDYALCVAAAHALLGLRSPRGARAVPVLRTSSEYSSKTSTRGPPSLASASKVTRKSLPQGAPPAPPSGYPPGVQLTAGGGNPNLTATLFSAMSGGVPSQPPQPGQAMLSHIRKLNLSQDTQQPRPASVARALSRARGEMSEAEQVARRSAIAQVPRGPVYSTDPMLHAPPGSLQATLTRPAYSTQGSNLAVAWQSPDAARDGGGTAVAAAAAAAETTEAAAAKAAEVAAAEAAAAEAAAAEAAAAEAANAPPRAARTFARRRRRQLG